MGNFGDTPAEEPARGDEKEDKTMEVDDESNSSSIDDESSSSSIEFVKTDVVWILKLGKDAYLHYGDGAGCHANFPVYFTTNKLDAFGNDRRLHLLKLLWELGERTLDKHAHEPVQDLICPDLFPNRLKKVPHPWSWNMDRIWRQYEKDQFTRKYGISREEFDEKHAPNFPKGTALRLGYLWLPSEFVVGVDRTVEIRSAISGLERNSDNAELYASIATLFGKMVPMWAKLGLIKEDVPTNLQVVVKAQSYLLEPGVQYSGKWHREGFRENIVASGVYYAEIEDGLHGGSLKFRVAQGPNEFYAKDARGKGPNGEHVDIDDIPTTRQLRIHEGRAVVFGNELPHRFRALSNISDKTARRTFLTFFIVDPAQRIPSTADMQIILPVRLREVVILTVRKAFNIELAGYIADEIGEFRGSHPRTLEEAKLKREEFRAAIREDKTGFVTLGYGNSGDTTYIKQWETHDRLPWEGNGYGSGFHSQSIQDEDWKDRGLAN